MSWKTITAFAGLYLAMISLVFLHCGGKEGEAPDVLGSVLSLAELEQVDEALTDEALGESSFMGILSLLRHRILSDSEEGLRFPKRFADRDRAFFHLTPEADSLEIESVSLDGLEMERLEGDSVCRSDFRRHRRILRPRFPSFWIEDFQLEPAHDYRFEVTGELPVSMTVTSPAYYPAVEGVSPGETVSRGADLSIKWGDASDDRARLVLFSVPWLTPEQRRDRQVRDRLPRERAAVVLEFDSNPGEAVISADLLAPLSRGRALLTVAVGRRIESDGGHYLARAESVQTIPLLLE